MEQIDAATRNEKQRAGPLSTYIQDAIDARSRLTPAGLKMVRMPDFYVEGLIQARLVGGLVSKGGMGKTSLLLWLGIATALGGCWMGRRVAQGAFVLISLDDSQEDLDAALALQCQGLSDEQIVQVLRYVHVISLRGYDGDDDLSFAVGDEKHIEATELADHLIAGLEGIEALRCIALDTVRQFSGGSTNNDRIMTLATKAATRVADHLGCSAILPHHGTKEGARNGTSDQYVGSGSGAFGDNLRFVLSVQPTDAKEINENLKLTGPERMVIATADALMRVDDTRGSLLRRAVPSMYVARREFHFAYIEGERKTVEEKTTEADRALLEAVKTLASDSATGWASVAILSKHLGRRNKAVTDDVARLEALGKVERKQGKGVRPKGPEKG